MMSKVVGGRFADNKRDLNGCNNKLKGDAYPVYFIKYINIISIIYFCVVTCYFSINLSLADNFGKNLDNKAVLGSTNNLSTITLDEKNQNLAGIKTQALEVAKQPVEFVTYGKVISPQPLLELRTKYLTLLAQNKSLYARFNESQQNLLRTKNLYAQGVVPARRLEDQQTRWQENKSHLDENGSQLQTLISSSRQVWGEPLTSWFVDSNDKKSGEFLQKKALLLQIIIPANIHLISEVKKTFIDETHQRQNAAPVTLISVSPIIDPISQSQTYFFKCQDRKVPYESQFTAWIATNNQNIKAISIPKSALVWHLGQAYVFIKTANDQFNRRLIPDLITSQQGYFSYENLHVGEEIVVTGAQTLLSQSLKSAIPGFDSN